MKGVKDGLKSELRINPGLNPEGSDDVMGEYTSS